ncbi:helix-turn-helix domain-containing protein [Streptomyces caniscabiei]|uniref:helix-turn-helix domain-containing protein n=1 Tax=Streptomyces caniscabiei TaxID=2746961 RepID=UPI000A3B5D30|nr:helix-turn-helix domain-containing protein [Streptomyces caniscabiei]
MPENTLPITQIAQLLGVSETELRSLMNQRDASHGDATLVGLTVAEAARRIGIGRTKLYEYVSSGEISSVKIGRLRRIPAEALNDFLARRPDSADYTTAA